jgi:hypothetical protein
MALHTAPGAQIHVQLGARSRDADAFAGGSLTQRALDEQIPTLCEGERSKVYSH